MQRTKRAKPVAKLRVTEPQRTHWPPRPGPCDRGDLEYLRRRITPLLVETLAREIRRTPEAVLEALVALARTKFEPPKTFTIDPDGLYGDERRTPAYSQRSVARAMGTTARV